MMKFNRVLLILLLVLALPVTVSAFASENPYYQQWARFQVGSSVTSTGDAAETEGESSFKQTITLKEVKSDHLLVQISRMEGSKNVNKSKRIDKLLNKTRIADLGHEEIAVAGKKYNCRKYKLTHLDDAGKEAMSFTYWFHPEIPGAAKIFALAKNPGGKITDTVTQTAVSWQKK